MSDVQPPPPPNYAHSPLPLHYAQSEPPIPFWDPSHVAFRTVRRLVFALGCGLVGYGVVSAWAQVNRSDAPYAAGWGAGLVALTAPWRRRREP